MNLHTHARGLDWGKRRSERKEALKNQVCLNCHRFETETLAHTAREGWAMRARKKMMIKGTTFSQGWIGYQTSTTYQTLGPLLCGHPAHV